jgi:tetratricopeptide (TPR) repeat protein
MNGALVLGKVPEGAPDPRECVVQAIEIAEELGSNYSTTVCRAQLGHAHWLTGHFEQAVEETRAALRRMEDKQNALDGLTSAQSTLSESLRELGELDGAIEAARAAVRTATGQPCIADGIRAQVALGLALLARGGPDDRAEAEACLEGARAWLGESGAAGFAGRVAELEARLAG